jgi:hypothetical protein
VNKREFYLAEARIAGYHNDTRTFTRLLIASRVRRELLNEAWHAGRRALSAGVPCTHCQMMKA